MSWASAERRAALAVLAGAVALGAGCGPPGPEQARPIGEAYVAAEKIELRRDIPPDSGAVGTAKRGEKVEILSKRRRFAKIRTAGKQEGWTEQSKLLAPELYQQIQKQAREAASLAGFGIYRARDTLNVHLEPYRASPSLYQLQEEDKVVLLGRRVVERTKTPPGSPPSQPVQYDDWRQVRTAEGSVGWVLTRMIDADIPDEVAQYADGRRITSYFPLAEVADGKLVKKNWLWTTVERGLEPHDFDSFRVFNWGRRRHRYETAYIERNLKGFFPVTVAGQVETRYGSGPGFSLVVEKKDGRRYTRRYVMAGFRVRMYGEEPVN